MNRTPRITRTILQPVLEMPSANELHHTGDDAEDSDDGADRRDGGDVEAEHGQREEGPDRSRHEELPPVTARIRGDVVLYPASRRFHLGPPW